MTKTQLLNCCMKETGMEPFETVLIGDSKYDAIGAIESGIDFIAVTYGFGFKSASDVEQYPNVCVCDSVKDIEGFILQ